MELTSTINITRESLPELLAQAAKECKEFKQDFIGSTQKFVHVEIFRNCVITIVEFDGEKSVEYYASILEGFDSGPVDRGTLPTKEMAIADGKEWVNRRAEQLHGPGNKLSTQVYGKVVGYC